MSSLISTIWIEKELIRRGLVPAECRLLEVSISPRSALVIRYEVGVRNDQLGAFADALKAAFEAHAAAEAARDVKSNEP